MAKNKPKERETTVLYVRVPTDLAARLRARVTELGWPHTLASVASEALEKGLAK